MSTRLRPVSSSKCGEHLHGSYELESEFPCRSPNSYFAQEPLGHVSSRYPLGDKCMGFFVAHAGRASGPLCCIQWFGQDLFWVGAQSAMWPTNLDFLSTAWPKRTGETLPAPKCWESLILRRRPFVMENKMATLLPPRSQDH